MNDQKIYFVRNSTAQNLIVELATTMYAPHGHPGQVGVNVLSLVEEEREPGLEPVSCPMVRQQHQNIFALEMKKKQKIATPINVQVKVLP